jgi:prepilin-type N-terminal cleavage/methylation domain-containing protein
MLSLKRPRRSRRAGFTMIEVLLVLAVLAVIAAVVTVTVGRSVQQGRSAALAQTLDGLRQAIYQYRTDVRRYPTHLTFLAAQPGSATDHCNRTVPPGFLNQWRGPYTPQAIGPTGIQVGDARVLNALEREGGGFFTIEQAGTLFIVVEGVDSLVAARLERAYDDETIGAGSYTSGVIRWAADVGTPGRGTLRFGLAVRGC